MGIELGLLKTKGGRTESMELTSSSDRIDMLSREGAPVRGRERGGKETVRKIRVKNISLRGENVVREGTGPEKAGNENGRL